MVVHLSLLSIHSTPGVGKKEQYFWWGKPGSDSPGVADSQQEQINIPEKKVATWLTLQEG